MTRMGLAGNVSWAVPRAETSISPPSNAAASRRDSFMVVSSICVCRWPGGMARHRQIVHLYERCSLLYVPAFGEDKLFPFTSVALCIMMLI